MNAFTQINSDYQERYERKNSPNYIVFNDYIGRMDPNEKEVWCLALESEEYAGKQGKLMLQTPDGKFCCLGVYCEIKGIPKHEALGELPFGTESTQGLVTVYGTEKDRASYTYIPHDFNIELTYDSPKSHDFEMFAYNGASGLFSAWTQTEDGKMDKFVEHTLPDLNDDGLTFAQIADVIRYFL